MIRSNDETQLSINQLYLLIKRKNLERAEANKILHVEELCGQEDLLYQNLSAVEVQ